MYFRMVFGVTSLLHVLFAGLSNKAVKLRGIALDEAHLHNSIIMLSAPSPARSSGVISTGLSHDVRNATHKLNADASPASVLRTTPRRA